MMISQIAKARRVIHMISNKLIVRNPESMKMIYQTYFQSTLLYSSEVWLSLECSTLRKLKQIDDSFWKLLPEGQEKPKCYNSIQIAIKKKLVMFFKHKFKLCKSVQTEDFCGFESLQTRESLKGNLKLPKCRLSVKTKRICLRYNKAQQFIKS